MLTLNYSIVHIKVFVEAHQGNFPYRKIVISVLLLSGMVPRSKPHFLRSLCGVKCLLDNCHFIWPRCSNQQPNLAPRLFSSLATPAGVASEK